MDSLSLSALLNYSQMGLRLLAVRSPSRFMALSCKLHPSFAISRESGVRLDGPVDVNKPKVSRRWCFQG